MASYSDNFDRASLGSGWTNIQRTWSILSSIRLICSGSSATWPAYTIYNTELDSANHECSITQAAQTNNSFVGPVVRSSSLASVSGYYLYSKSGSGHRLYFAGTETLVNTGTGDSGTNTRTLSASGAIFTGTVGGTQVFEYEDVDYASRLGTYCGVAGHPSDTSTGDNWSAEDLAASSTPTLSNPTATVTGTTTATVGVTVAY